MRRLGIAIAFVAIGSLAFVAPALAAAATPEEWRAQAEDVCVEGNTVLGAVVASYASEYPDGLGPAQADELASVYLADIFEVLHDKLADLEKPASLKKKINKMLKSLRTSIAALRAGGFDSIEEAEATLEAPGRRANKLGLQACGLESGS